MENLNSVLNQSRNYFACSLWWDWKVLRLRSRRHFHKLLHRPRRGIRRWTLFVFDWLGAFAYIPNLFAVSPLRMIKMQISFWRRKKKTCIHVFRLFGEHFFQMAVCVSIGTKLLSTCSSVSWARDWNFEASTEHKKKNIREMHKYKVKKKLVNEPNEWWLHSHLLLRVAEGLKQFSINSRC